MTQGLGVVVLLFDERLARFQAGVFDLVPYPVVLVEPTTQLVTFANKATSRLLACPHSELLGVQLVGMRLRRKDGPSIIVESDGHEVVDPTGRAVLVCVARDLPAYLVDAADRPEAPEPPAVREDWFRAAFEQTPIGTELVRVYPDGARQIVWANEALAHLLGEPVEDLVGSSPERFPLPGDGSGDAASTDLLATGQITRIGPAKQYRRRDGTRLWAEASATVIDPRGCADGPERLTLAHVVDVTARHLEGQRRAQSAALHELMAQVVTQVLAGQPSRVRNQQVVDGVARVFAAENVAMVVPDPLTGRLVHAAAVGPFFNPLTGASLLMQEAVDWLTGQAVQGAALPDPLPGLPLQRAGQLGPAAAAWFAAGPDIRGVLVAARGRGQDQFATEEVSLLSDLAQQVTLAIRLEQSRDDLRRQATDRDTYLARLEAALRPLSDPEQIRATACRLLGERLGVARVLYVDVDGEDHRVAVVRQEYLNGVGPMPPRFPIAGEVDLHRELPDAPLVIDDLAGDFQITQAKRSARLRMGVAALVIVPLVKAGSWIASLGVHASSPRRWTTLDVQLVRDTAERTWAAAERSLAERASDEDRHRRREAERQLVEQAARELRDQAGQDFITNASHELRTPLTAILAALDSLDAGAADDPTERTRFLAHLRREATRLARLSGSLLLLAGAQSVGTLPRRAIAVHEMLDGVAAAMTVAEAVTVSVEADHSLLLHTEPGLAEVLLGNLAANAAKYTADGHIVLSARTKADGLVIEIRDSGPGMNERILARSQERYYRHDGARSGEGFGVGLSIVTQAAAALGAYLDLDSEPGSGTRARVTFPAHPHTQHTPESHGPESHTDESHRTGE